ncbi:MAG: glyoxalase [Euryarchaeota archaeon TMED255]|nr:MAG: glyoxalase [Euryarchaeota archaeon TMED255]
MIGYVTLGTGDLEKAKSYYSALLGEIGASQLIANDRLAMYGTSMKSPMLAVCIPYDEGDAHPGNGTMVAIDPGSKEMVDKLYSKAIELGGTCDGEPGERVPDVFYGAYVRDPDGNKLAFYQFGSALAK